VHAEALEKDFIPIGEAIIALRNPHTKLSPSHWGHPGYENLAFLYDKAIDALILNALGYAQEAQDILDYFAARLRIPIQEIRLRADINGVYGILKLYRAGEQARVETKALLNAFDITSVRKQGKGSLEFCTTPGPISFLIFAMLGVDSDKYRLEASTLGEVLLAMQDEEGGVRDGDRDFDKIHTEPHIDAYAAFRMLYEVTGEEIWQQAAEKAWGWFERNVYQPQKGIIDQGVWYGERNKIFAEDVYSWTMASPAGDRIPLFVLKKLTETMLSESLVEITLSLPDGRRPTVILVDFSNSEDQRVEDVRGGFYPMGSVEWSAGCVLALKKNAVRFWQGGQEITARFYKALAEYLQQEIIKCFYSLNEVRGRMTFYATAQGVEVGPFGSIEQGGASGWKTPFFYVRTPQGKVALKGGSAIGGWVVFPALGVNPFILNDRFLGIYKCIPSTPEDERKAYKFLRERVSSRTISEEIPTAAPSRATQIVEPGVFNYQMWKAFSYAYAARERGNYALAKAYFREAIEWAERTISDSHWFSMAKRDNRLKEKEMGGIISYPWGQTYPENDHPLHYAILRYPFLNEVAVAMWGMATAHFELGDRAKAKYWMIRIMEDVPLHQIADIVGIESDTPGMIRGYWNALVSWENNSSTQKRSRGISNLYQEILKEKGISSARPEFISSPFQDLN